MRTLSNVDSGLRLGLQLEVTTLERCRVFGSHVPLRRGSGGGGRRAGSEVVTDGAANEVESSRAQGGPV